MSGDDEENVPEGQSGLVPEELGRMGLDEEQIFNFLHDAIGPEVGTEVLREFSNSDHFAELLDVVNNSLAAEDGRSRRGSTEAERVAEIRSDIPTYPTPNSSPNTPDDVQVVDECRKGSSTSGSSVKVCDTGHINDHQPEEILISKESIYKSLIDDTILQKADVEHSERESYTDCMSSTKPTSDCEIVDVTSQLNDTNQDEIVKNIDPNDTPEQLQPEICSTKDKFIPVFDKEFLKYQTQYNLKHCSTILCNVIGLESDFIDLTCESANDSNKKIVNVPKEKIKEIHRKEKATRISFSVRLNKSLDSNILERIKRGSETIISNEIRKAKDGKHKSDKDHEGKNKSRRGIESGSDNSSSSSDIQYVKRKKESSPNSKKREEREPELSKGKTEYSAGGTRILPFERKRIPDENRPRKFDKFERMLKEKSKGVKKENKPMVKVEPSVPEKTFASSSFRIPKKKDGQRHKPEKKITSLTPLASQDVPSENLKFERYRKTKNEDRHSKTDPYQNKEGSRETYLNETIKIEIELADEPDSFADEDCAASQAAPLSEVQVGHLVLSVATFLRENPQVELPLAEDTATVSELLVVKIAWWFRTLEKDPSSDEILVPELSDAPIPICEEDDNDGSDSFLGHVSNPGEETEECQINEVSSSSYRYEAEDSGKSDEYCGRALLQAKIRTAGENFQNIFDLRNGASYDTKENFQAKCNLCNELIVGKTNLSLHVKKEEHWKNLLNTSLKMAKSDDKSEVKLKVTEPKPDKSDNKDKDSKMKEKEREKDKEKSVKKETDQNGKTDGDKAAAKPRPGKVEMERTKTSTGLPIRVPVMPGTNRKRSRSKSRTRSPRRRKSKSPRGKSRSPIQFIVRSPQRHSIRHSPPRHRHKRRSRSRSPHKRSRSPRHLPINIRSRTPPNRRRSSSIERVEEFLARTNRGRRSRSPSNSKRQRRSRSRSPKPFVKPDNKEFHEKLALTVDGKWTADMENRWNLMETEQNMYLKQFQDRQKQLQDKPEDHPRYADEWTEFWERRYQEVEKSGKDPDSYDYVIEWKDFWLKRVMFLLQAEGDMKIKEIKKKYGMDYESLRNLRFTPVVETVKVEVDSFLPQLNPQNPVIVPRSVLNFPPPLSVSDRGSDDQMSRAMSISDDGRSDHKSKEPSSKACPKKSNVTVDDIKSTWESLTGQKIGSPKSDAGSSSVASYDFDGFDLVQVLRLMCQIDQTLGIYAQRVQEFFKMAEELEISKRNKSYSLLNKKDFVELLFKCRDKFMNVIRANVVARDVLKSINLTVYALNAILDSPQCQQFKPALDATLSMELEPQLVPSPVEVPKSLPVASVKEEIAPSQVSPVVRRQLSENDKSSTICDAVAHLSLAQKNEIAGLIAKTLVMGGRENINDSALMQHLSLVFAPMIAKITVTQESSRSRNPESMRESSAFSSIGGTRRNEESHPPNVSITARRSTGTGLPPLPTFGTRAATPPPSVQNPLQNAPNPFVSSGSNSRSQYHPYGGSRGFGRGRPTSPVSSGRRSPFSRRGYAGNPAPEDKDTDEEDNVFIYDRERPPSDINITEAVSKLSNHLLATKAGIYSPPSSLSVSSEDPSLDDVPTSVKLPPGILNLIRKERSSEANASSRYTSAPRTNARNLSPQDRERNRGRKCKKERRSRHSNSPSERKENNRNGRQEWHCRGKPRRDWIDENRERRSRRHRRTRRSKSSSRSSVVRLPLQGPSQGVNSTLNRGSPSAIDERESIERQSSTPFNYGTERIEMTDNIQNTERKSNPSKLSKPSRGVSAIFWETSSVSGGEGKFDKGAEDAFTEDKIKARHYRTQKADLEPGEILSSSTDFSEAESRINSCDPRMKKRRVKHKPKKSCSAKKTEKEVIVSVPADSQDSFNDFDECMTKENIVPVVDLDTSFEDGDKDPRKIQLDLPITVPLVLENVSEFSHDKISDGSLTDYESPRSPTKLQKISLTEPITPQTAKTISCKTKSVVESPIKKRTGEQSSDIFPLGSEILSDGELSDVTVGPGLEDNSSISTSNFSSKSNKLERIDSAEDDVLSKVSTVSSANIPELKNDSNENLNHTDISTEDSAHESVVIDLVQSPSKEKESSNQDEDQKNEFIVPVICDEQQSLPISEKSPKCSKANEVDADVATDILPSTNVDSKEIDCGNESQSFVISISKNIFEPVDASSDDEIEGESNEISIKPLDAANFTNGEMELEDDKFSKPLNDVPLVITKVNLSAPQPITPSDVDSIENGAEEALMDDLNVAQVVDVEYLDVTEAVPQNNQPNSDDDDNDDRENSHVEAKVLIESELVIVKLDDLDVTDKIEVTEEFLQ